MLALLVLALWLSVSVCSLAPGLEREKQESGVRSEQQPVAHHLQLCCYVSLAGFVVTNTAAVSKSSPLGFDPQVPKRRLQCWC